MSRETEIILLALDFYARVRSGAAAPEAKQVAQDIRNKQLVKGNAI